MKKLILTLLTFLLLAGTAFTANVNLTATWEQPDYDRVDKWVLFHSTTAGGPYAPIGTLTKAEAETEGLLKEFDVTSPDGQKVTHYFVVVAYDDDMGTFSGNSNEASKEIDFTPVQAAGNLTVILRVTPQ